MRKHDAVQEKKSAYVRGPTICLNNIGRKIAEHNGYLSNFYTLHLDPYENWLVIYAYNHSIKA